MFNFGTGEIVLIFIAALLIFGPKRLPDMGKAVGSAIQEFRNAISGNNPAKQPDLLPKAGEDVKKEENKTPAG